MITLQFFRKSINQIFCGGDGALNNLMRKKISDYNITRVTIITQQSRYKGYVYIEDTLSQNDGALHESDVVVAASNEYKRLKSFRRQKI